MSRFQVVVIKVVVIKVVVIKGGIKVVGTFQAVRRRLSCAPLTHIHLGSNTGYGGSGSGY